MKVDAVKRNCIKVLPHMLVIHLKRFEYDYNTMNRWKIKDRCASLRKSLYFPDQMPEPHSQPIILCQPKCLPRLWCHCL